MRQVSFFSRFWALFFRRPPARQERDAARYEHEKKIARSGDIKGKMTLAGESQTHQEILYYLAEHDPDPAIRKAVIHNRSLPLQAGPLLAEDKDQDVRIALAERLVTLLPDLETERHSQLYAFAVQSLATLALDEVLTIRKALSSALQDYALAPPKVVNRLARDLERDVSEPVLKFCAAVSDDTLLEILKDHPSGWAVQAIAGRKTVSTTIAQAVINTKDRPAGAILIGNKGADISRETLEDIISRARSYPEWQTHLAGRADLPPDLAKDLAVFADQSVRELLMKRADFDEETISDIAAIVKRRVDFPRGTGQGKIESPVKRVRMLAMDGRLDEDMISDALAMRDRDFVHAALAYLAGTDLETVKKICAMQAPKAIIALSWKAGLSMRFALRLQKEMGQIQPRNLIYPREGTDYPLSEDELQWQLEFIGLA